MKKQIEVDIQAWLTGEDNAYRRIFDYYYPILIKLCKNNIKGHEDCEEIVMNVFLNIWRHRNQLHQIESFEKYFYQSLRNQITDFRRKKIQEIQSIDELPIKDTSTDLNEQLAYQDLLKIYQQTLDRLTPTQKEVFVLSREAGLSQKEIADKLQSSASTINNHLTAALKVLRKTLAIMLKS